MQWFALFRPGREEPEAVDFDRSDLISLALRRALKYPPYRDRRDAAWKRLRRRGWRLKVLPERFWEQSWVAWERQARANAEAYQRLERSKGSLDLLRDLAEDRHKLGLDMAEEGWTGYGHRGTLRTCSDRLCEQAAELLR